VVDLTALLLFEADHVVLSLSCTGGCQAIEDAYVLTEQLANTKSTSKIEDALKGYFNKRIIRVSVVQFMSRLASDLIINAFDTPWSPHDDLGKSWKSYLTFFWKPILQYVIFPLQFAYLYSYYPTGSMKEIAADLEEKWRTKHFEASEEVFARVATEGQTASGPSFFKKAEVVRN